MRNMSKVVALGRSMPTMNKAEIRVYSSAGEGLLLFSVLVVFTLSEFVANLHVVNLSGLKQRS